ncbi:MAG: hypothetical protein Kow0069_04660 [Promethearchaeota archaeon]
MVGEKSEDLDATHLVGLKKSGSVTIPKAVRDALSLDETSQFKLTVGDDRIVLEVLTPEEALRLKEDLGATKRTRARPGGGTRAPSRGGGKKKGKGPVFEGGKYVEYPFPNQEQVLRVLEDAFSEAKSPNPDLEELANRVTLAVKAYSTGNRVENARLRYSVVLFLCDVAQTFGFHNLVDVGVQLVEGMKSRFLVEQSLAKLAVTVKGTKPERTAEFVAKILENVEKYDPTTEMYALVHSLESVAKEFVRAGFPETFLEPIKEFLKKRVGNADRDYKLQVVEILERMHFIEEALAIANEVLMSMDPEAPGVDEVREIVKRLSETPI